MCLLGINPMTWFSWCAIKSVVVKRTSSSVLAPIVAVLIRSGWTVKVLSTYLYQLYRVGQHVSKSLGECWTFKIFIKLKSKISVPIPGFHFWSIFKKCHWNLPWRFHVVGLFFFFFLILWALLLFKRIQVANSWILEVVQIHLCQVFLGLFWSDEGPDGIILHTKKYMKKLFKKKKEWKPGDGRS